MLPEDWRTEVATPHEAPGAALGTALGGLVCPTGFCSLGNLRSGLRGGYEDALPLIRAGTTAQSCARLSPHSVNGLVACRDPGMWAHLQAAWGLQGPVPSSSEGHRKHTNAGRGASGRSLVSSWPDVCLLGLLPACPESPARGPGLSRAPMPGACSCRRPSSILRPSPHFPGDSS